MGSGEQSSAAYANALALAKEVFVNVVSVRLELGNTDTINNSSVRLKFGEFAPN